MPGNLAVFAPIAASPVPATESRSTGAAAVIHGADDELVQARRSEHDNDLLPHSEARSWRAPPHALAKSEHAGSLDPRGPGRRQSERAGETQALREDVELGVDRPGTNLRARTYVAVGRQSRSVAGDLHGGDDEPVDGGPRTDRGETGAAQVPAQSFSPNVAPSATSEDATPPSAIEKERLLVAQAQSGDALAFGALYRLHVHAVFRYAVAPLVRDRALAEELVADTFVRAHENLARFEWQGRSILPWLVRIGRNLALDALRRGRRMVPLAEGKAARLPARESHGDVEDALARGELRDQARARVQETLAQLSERYRLVITLRLLELRSRDESAQVLEVTVGTLDVLLCRACKSFRKTYSESFGPDALENLELG